MEIHLDNGQYLDLPTDLELNVSHSNPLISEQGTYSLPVLLPGTENNRKMLKNPQRFDNVYKDVIKLPAYIKQGLFQKKASLNILEAGDDIDTFFQMNESEMYAKMKETKLSTAFDIKRYPAEFLPDMAFDDDMDRMIRYLEQVMIGNIDDDFHLFEVATDTRSLTLESNNQTYDVYQFLNELAFRMSFQNYEHDTYDTDPSGRKYRVLRARYDHTVVLNNNLVQVPKGYGITPFLKLNYILTRIFEYFGYELDLSYFESDDNLNRIVIPNNTADALMRGYIDYAQLVPTGTINDFLDNVRKAFGCEFFVSEDNRKVEVKFWNDVLSDIRLDKDWTPYLTSLPKKKIIEPKTVKMTFKRSFDKSEVAYSTLAEFEAKFGKLNPINQMPATSQLGPYDEGFYFVRNCRQIWEIYLDSDVGYKRVKIYGYPLFDYYIDEDLEYEEKECDLEFIPNVSGLRCKGFIYSENDIKSNTSYVYFPSPNNVYTSPVYFGERRHMNTVLEKTDSSQETTVVKETAGDCPMSILYFRTDYFINESNLENLDYEIIGYGTVFGYDRNGAITGALDLIPGGDTGLYDRFYKKLDDVLRNSYQQITVTLNLPEKDIANFRMDKLICIEHQPLLPELFEYTVKEKDIDVNKVVFRTIRIYKDR